VEGVGVASERERPNIVFLLTDDMAYGDPGCYGGKFEVCSRTEYRSTIDSARTRFEQFYVDAPLCAPSRAAFLTGMFPARWG